MRFAAPSACIARIASRALPCCSGQQHTCCPFNLLLHCLVQLWLPKLLAEQESAAKASRELSVLTEVCK